MCENTVESYNLEQQFACILSFAAQAQVPTLKLKPLILILHFYRKNKIEKPPDDTKYKTNDRKLCIMPCKGGQAQKAGTVETKYLK